MLFDDTLLDDGQDEALIQAADRGERQAQHQIQLGGNPLAAQRGRFRLVPEPLHERRSQKFGLHERVVRLRPVQEGRLIPQQQLADALTRGLRRALEQVLDQQKVPDTDRFYISLASDRLRSASNAFHLTAQEWRQNGLRHARLHLYRALDHLGPRVLYSDTDSVVFVQRPDDPPIQPPLGDFLGDFTDELDPGDHIVQFCSGGPKNYGYMTARGKTECKVRGFSLNAEGQAHLNYQILRQNTLDELRTPQAQPRVTPNPQRAQGCQTVSTQHPISVRLQTGLQQTDPRSLHVLHVPVWLPHPRSSKHTFVIRHVKLYDVIKKTR